MTWCLLEDDSATFEINSGEFCSFLSNIRSQLETVYLLIYCDDLWHFSTSATQKPPINISSKSPPASQTPISSHLDVPTPSLVLVVSEDDITFTSHLCFGFSCQSLVFRNNTLPWLRQFFRRALCSAQLLSGHDILRCKIKIKSISCSSG